MSKIYIHKAQSISPVPSFENGAYNALQSSKTEGKAIHPDYKSLLKVPGLRRMSEIIKMALTCGLDVAKDQPIDAIIVGSGLGNLTHTVTFLNQVETNEDAKPISPTQFIQSTHNTIAGQLALLQQCNQYNMTHVQAGVSFETAAIDAVMKIEGQQYENILLGVVDELHPLMLEWGEKAGLSIEKIGEGASFFYLSPFESQENVVLSFTDVILPGQVQEILTEQEITDVFYVNSHVSEDQIQESINGNVIDFTDRCGIYWSNSGLIFQAAYEVLAEGKEVAEWGKTSKKIAVVNNYNNQFVGVSILEKL